MKFVKSTEIGPTNPAQCLVDTTRLWRTNTICASATDGTARFGSALDGFAGLPTFETVSVTYQYHYIHIYVYVYVYR